MADDWIETAQNTKHEKFQMYRNKLEKIVNEQDYFSYSEDSEDGLEEALEADAEDELKEVQFYRKSQKLQKEGLLSLLRIIKKS